MHFEWTSISITTVILIVFINFLLYNVFRAFAQNNIVHRNKKIQPNYPQFATNLKSHQTHRIVQYKAICEKKIISIFDFQSISPTEN